MAARSVILPAATAPIGPRAGEEVVGGVERVGAHGIEHARHHRALLGEQLLELLDVVVEAGERRFDDVALVLLETDERLALVLDALPRLIDALALRADVVGEGAREELGASTREPLFEGSEVRLLAGGVLARRARR